MNGLARLAACCAIVWVSAGNTAFLQVNSQPTPAPTITAEREPWYLNGDPVTYAGSIYYPAGPEIHFIPNEMVRSGFYQGIPIYSRTTIEPYSVIFVPLPGGLMQPYERQRTGQIAGTAGSAAPHFPVAPYTGPAATMGTTPLPQAPAPPTVTGPLPDSIVGTTGTAAPVVTAQAGNRVVYLPRPAPVKSAERPKGINGVFIDFRNNRWFSSGAPTPLDPDRYTRIGEYRGFSVYAPRGGGAGTIYVPMTRDSTDLLIPFTRRGR
ncbi:MAG: hypothetical protein A3H96_13385 [Acidobacteria bacterium RIFCSPLOWO2_02_FULL_67_36]|nr:MAG: hypothetical protein A3H96_13385 [Acidobacteria bacterium RIFCSPLOWO2_02_FULL_67_36]OFW18562.1 MAG: hypothetical protein A3G21_21050 [Acidobacteria bacterium RIFCSPLOWO2_12_FULL_66_21]